VFDSRLSQWFDSVLPGAVRWVNNNDIVPRLPLPAWKWAARYIPFAWLLPAGFRHVGVMRYVTADGEDVLTDPPLDVLMADRLGGRWLAGKHWATDGSRDHAVWHYQDATRAWEHKRELEKAAT
jgi:hypothetical protein